MGDCCNPCRNNGGILSGNNNNIIWIIIAIVVIIWIFGDNNNDCCCWLTWTDMAVYGRVGEIFKTLHYTAVLYVNNI